MSVPFTWLMDQANEIAAKFDGLTVIGGPGTMKPTVYEGFDPVELHNFQATFTTRGCPNRCSFCAVPKIEGEFRELPNFRPAPIVCDNNFLASSKVHFYKVVTALQKFPEIDFNQGLDARLFTPLIADALGRLNCRVRFSLDHTNLVGVVKDAIDLCRKRTTKRINIYVLFGFNDTIDDALYRLEIVRSWKLFPNAMRYQPLDARKKNDYVASGWTEHDLKRIARYYNRLAWLNGIPFKDYWL